MTKIFREVVNKLIEYNAIFFKENERTKAKDDKVYYQFIYRAFIKAKPKGYKRLQFNKDNIAVLEHGIMPVTFKIDESSNLFINAAFYKKSPNPIIAKVEADLYVVNNILIKI